MRVAIVVALGLAAARAEAAPATFAGGHITMTVPAGWQRGAHDAAESIGKGTTSVMIFVLPGAPETLLDLAQAAEADTIVYTDRGHGAFGGLRVIASQGHEKSGKGGARRIFAGAACIGTVVIAESLEGNISRKDAADLAAAIKSLTYDPDQGSAFVNVGAENFAKLDAAARKAAETFARATCLGGAHDLEDLSAGSIEVDGTALDRTAFDAAVARTGDLATYLHMASGMWGIDLDPDDAKHFGLVREATKAQAEAGGASEALFEQVGGAWKLTKIKRAAP